MHHPHYTKALICLKNNDTLITPNNRLAKTLLEDYLIDSSTKVIPKPNCIAYDAFVQHLYHQFTHQYPNDMHPMLLTAQQSSYLWKRQLTGQASSLHQGLINKAFEAWRRCQLWHIDTNHIQFEQTEQTQQFQQWCSSFLMQLNELNVITQELVIPYLITQDKLCPLGSVNKVVWFCFDDYTPQQLSLKQYFSNNGIQDNNLDLTEKQSDATLFAAADNQHEITALIAWLQQEMAQGKKRIGVIVPDLHQKANQLNRQLQQHFAPDHYNLSLGNPLAAAALISHALCWISLDKKVITQEQAALLLSSPFLAFSKTELIARAQFLQDNPLLQERLIDYKLLSKELSKHAPLLATLLQTLTVYPKQANPHDWIHYFQERLTQLGFPGEYTLDSKNYQYYQRFQQLFDEFKQLSLLTPMMSASEAIQLLRENCQTILFQPEKKATAPIQILGLLEASGCQFEALWIMGMTDECIPKKTQLSPFIPLGIQKTQGLPYTSPEKEWHLANIALNRFNTATDTIIFSYPAYTDDKSNLPTPLLTHLPPFSYDMPTLSANQPNVTLENYHDTYHIPLTLENGYSGSTSLLANQAKCPFRAFAAHRLHLKKNNDVSEGLNARERGMIIHKIMEILWQQLINQHNLLKLSTEELAVLIDDAINTTLAPYQLRRKYSFPPLIQRIEKNRLKKLVDAILAWEKQRPAFSVTGIEKNFSIQLANIDFNVRVDRLDTVDHSQKWVIDYKTSLPQRTPWKEERPTEPQILLYALLDEQINTILFAELKNGQFSCKGLSEDHHDIQGIKTTEEQQSWQSLKTQWHQQLASLAQEFQEGFCPPNPTHASICEQCDYSDLCRFLLKD